MLHIQLQRKRSICEGIIKVNAKNEKWLNVVVKELQSRWMPEYNKEKNQVTNLIQNQFSILEKKLTTKIEDAINLIIKDLQN